VELVSEGLDTFANITFNGIFLGCTDNSFRTWTYDIKKLIKGSASNTLHIKFTAAEKKV
jgi:beta-mannosidase